MPKVGEIFIEIFAKNQRLRGGLAEASSLIRDWSLVVTGLTQGITNAFRKIATVGIKAVTISLATLTTAFAVTAKSGADFQDNIVRAFVIMRESSGATAKSLRDLTQEAIRLGSETLFSATQAAIGLQTLARAGFTTQQAISAIGPVLDLAIVGNIELAEASNIATAAMFGFGLEATDMTKVVDVLSLASSQANTTISLLGSALGFVAPVAFSAGLSIEETSAAIGVLSNAGIRGSRAGTTLRRALSILLAPTGRAKKIFDELGLTFNNAEGGLISFTEIIAKLNKANLTAAQTQTIFGRIAGPGMAALLRQGSGALDGLTGKLEGAEGAADRMSQSFRTTVKGRVRDLGASLINLGLAFSEKFNKPLADTIFGIRNFVKDITEALQRTGIFNAIVQGTITALTPLTDKIKELANRFKDFLLGLTPESISAFFDTVRIKISEFIKKIVENTEAIKSFFSGAIDAIKGFINPIITIITIFDGWSEETKTVIANIVGLTSTILFLTGGIIPLISLVVLLGLAFRPLRLAVVAFIGTLFKGTPIVTGFAATTGVASGGLVAFGVAVKGATIAVLSLLSPLLIVAGAFSVIFGILGLIRDGDFLGGVIDGFKSLGGGLSDIVSKLGGIFDGGLDEMKEMVNSKNIFEDLPNQLKESMKGAGELTSSEDGPIKIGKVTFESEAGKAAAKRSLERRKKLGITNDINIPRLISQGVNVKSGDSDNEVNFLKQIDLVKKLGVSAEETRLHIQDLEKQFGTSFQKINSNRRSRSTGDAPLPHGLPLLPNNPTALDLILRNINPIDNIFGPKEASPGFGRGKDLEGVNRTSNEQRISNLTEGLNTSTVKGMSIKDANAKALADSAIGLTKELDVFIDKNAGSGVEEAMAEAKKAIDNMTKKIRAAHTTKVAKIASSNPANGLE